MRIGYDSETLTNFLTALIHPRDIPARAKSPQQPIKKPDGGYSSSSSLSNEVENERQKTIDKLSEETQGVLYHFNKIKMNQFYEHP
jgi:hypothetical protein